MSKLTVFAVALLLLVAGAGGAAAGSLVTSKNIKDGTISVRDLNSSLKSAIKATPMVNGTVIQDGTVGVADLDATAQAALAAGRGAGDVKIVSSASGTAYCPVGYQVIGGGGVVPVPDSFYYTVLLGSAPVGTNAWRVSAQKFRSSDGTQVFGGGGTAYAICAL